MNRSKPLERRTPLATNPEKTLSGRSSAPLRRSEGLGRGKPSARKPSPRAARRRAAPGRDAWYDFPRRGPCEACGRRGFRLVAHHVLIEQYVERLAPERIWALANRMLICWRCHERHHASEIEDRRIARSRVPAPAVAFARELLGEAAERYFQKRYRAA